jgi:hypothetical protein
MSNGDRFAAGRVFGTWATDVAWSDATIGDVDGDGRSDLLGRNPTTGQWLVSRSTGTAFTTSTFGGFANPQTWGQFVAGDFNFDGKTDIAGRNQRTGTWRLLQSSGTQFGRPQVFGTWPTTAAWSNVLPLRIPFLLSRLDPPVMSGNLGGSFWGGSMAFAAPGDTNIDWSIDILDAAPFLSGGTFVSGTPALWNQGDFAYEGVVDVAL